MSAIPFTTSTGEGPGNLANANASFFRDPKFLTVSAQLHLEAFVNEHQKVWTLSPCFRAERSDTPRHVSEFMMLEAEMQTESLLELMDLAESLIRSLTLHLRESGFMQELTRAHRVSVPLEGSGNLSYPKLLEQRWHGLLQSPWPRITYEGAIQHLNVALESNKTIFQYHPSLATGLQLEHEKYLAKTVGHGSPVFVTDYPAGIKPFYMLPSKPVTTNEPTGTETVSCFDLLFPDMCEVVGGSLREHRLQGLTQAMHGFGLSVAPENPLSEATTDVTMSPSAGKGDLDWYVDLRRYGSVPHGGFGLGFDRLLGYLAGIDNIKDVVPWPRYYGKCDC